MLRLGEEPRQAHQPCPLPTGGGPQARALGPLDKAETLAVTDGAPQASQWG